MVATTDCFLCKAARVVGSRQCHRTPRPPPPAPTALELIAPDQGEVRDLSDLCTETNKHHCHCTLLRRL